MSIKKYTSEHIDYLREISDGHHRLEITQMMNDRFPGMEFDLCKVKNLMSKYGIRNGLFHKSHPGKSKWPEEVRTYIFDHYQGTGHKAMAEQIRAQFGVEMTKEQVKRFYANHKLDSGLDGRFERGRISPTKGKKWMDFMPEESARSSKRTCFKKGHVPYNRMPVGSEVVNVEGYRWVKITEPDVWREKHHVVWEQHNGPIPDDMILTFLDGDKNNICLENLCLVSLEENLMLTRNDARRENPDIPIVTLTAFRLEKAVKERVRRMEK